MSKIVFLSILIFLFFDGRVLAQDEEVFIDFYYKFITDSTFQENRTKYPLKGSYIIDYDSEIDENFVWMPESKPFYTSRGLEKSNMILERSYQDSLVVERTFIKDSGFEIKVEFERIGRVWYLVSMYVLSI